MNANKRKTYLILLSAVLAMFLARPAYAARNMGICTEWNPDGLQGCTIENPLTGTIVSDDPVFSIAVNDGKTIQNVVLLVLVPQPGSSPTFDVTFTPTVGASVGPNSADSTFNFSSGELIASIPTPPPFLVRWISALSIRVPIGISTRLTTCSSRTASPAMTSVFSCRDSRLKASHFPAAARLSRLPSRTSQGAHFRSEPSSLPSVWRHSALLM